MFKRVIRIIIIIIVAFFILLVIRGEEDTWLCVDGQWIKHGNPRAPMPTENCLKEKSEKPESNIIVDLPKPDEEIGLPLVITGQARVFESQFNYRLKDEDGTILTEGLGMANSPDAGFYGQFIIEANYPQPKGFSGTVEVFDYSAKDGAEIDKVIIPVKFKEVEALTIKVYFNNDRLDPEFSCNKVFPVERRIGKTQAIAKAALEELLKGIASQERAVGFITNINQGVKINSLNIENGVAQVDFDETLEFQVGGSCRVAAISAQITETLKQFPTVSEVIISINGRTEDILQP